MSMLLIWWVVFLLATGVLAYRRASLLIWSISFALLLALLTKYAGFSVGVQISWITYLAFFSLLNIKYLRRQLFSKFLFRFYVAVMPAMSRTERAAIKAGTVTWEGDLFRGDPNWQTLLALPQSQLTTEEQAFLDGPVDALCQMIDDWDITHRRLDLPPAVWTYLKEQGFFALIIPKQYGGKGFSAYAHSQILIKVSSRSLVAATTIAVPNSLGPAELLLHYGTEEQKKHYLPRLAKGTDIPCFALTSPEAGSDAGSMTDHGIVCWDDFGGKCTLGIKLNFNKRYITLAPVATVIGLAFKLYDPSQLLGKKEDIGITCALIPRETRGITIGRRHFPLNMPFQNGPIQGKDVFIPLDWVIGGINKVGEGWVMLMECLAAGRAISLPAFSVGGAKMATYTTGAYARIRRQFNSAIGKFEGVEEYLARIATLTYMMDATRLFTVRAIDAGQKPAVASAIAKYHVTELGRKVASDSMDVHGGKGICLGPHNYIGRSYEATPIGITVEGANILTRNMIIFGQGVMRCHPFLMKELEAVRLHDQKQALIRFDNAIIGHIGFALSNAWRTLVLSITSGVFVRAPAGKMKRYFQQATRFCSALAFFSDVSMLCYGGNLKRKESISARLGDVLSYLYLLSAVLKHYENQGKQSEDLALVKYASLHCLFEIQESFDGLIRAFPYRTIAWLLKVMIFPWGQRFSKPNDKIKHKVAQILLNPSASRDRLAEGAFLTAVPQNSLADVQDALLKVIASEPIEKIIRAAVKEEKITGYTLREQAQAAFDTNIISHEQFHLYLAADEARSKVIAVDDFDPDELKSHA
ncbi:MAG TPA: acyl-CoA dehydrogenase [Gammaproteobacteria bacterium]|jgi:acyl-CoA dehydrogenase|nr:acyl-CoA dehydrogenase [Gammaproteobacteria bacterium]